MRFKVVAAVESDALIPESPLIVESDPYLLTFEAGDDGKVNKVSVERPVQEYKHLLPTLIWVTESHSALTYPNNPIHSDMLALLQYLESMGSFWCSIRQIHWDRADGDWIPGSDAERSELAVWGLQVDEHYPTIVTTIDASLVRGLLRRRPQHERFTVPMAFYREGQNEFVRFRYVQAFVNFYFMLEGLFGRGRPNYRVKEEFRSSPTLMAAASAAALTIQQSPRHLEGLRSLTGSAEQILDASVVLDWLVDLRGLVHHYSVTDSRPQAHPNNQRTFEPAALLAMAVCTKLLPKIIGDRPVPPDVP